MALTLNSRGHGVPATAPYRASIQAANGTLRTVKSTIGILRGVWFSAASDVPTFKLFDDTAGGADILVGTFTPAAANFYDLGDCIFKTGLTLSTTGTVDFTIFYF